MPTPPRYITARGRTQTLREWSAETGLHPNTITSRIDRLGMTADAALAKPSARKLDHRRKPEPAAAADCPPVRKHSGGQAYARWTAEDGRRVARYFGVWGSPEAERAYERFRREWVRSPSLPDRGESLSVAALVDAHLDHVESYYVKDGRPTSEVAVTRAALAFLLPLADVPVADVKGRHLKDAQSAMVAAGLSRRTVNTYTGRLVRCFRWGVGDDLAPPEVAAVLECVPRLAAGRSAAPDRRPVRSVPPGAVERTLARMHPDPGRAKVLAAMVRFQLLTGARPGEVCGMRGDSIDTSGKCWSFAVERDKNAHRGETRRVVWIGPKARKLLAPFLAAAKGGRVWVLPPARGRTARTPVSRHEYARHVRAACRRAGVADWHPHQLRHNRATEIARLYESDAAAAAAIGDTPAVTAAVYVDPSEAVAKRIALATG